MLSFSVLFYVALAAVAPGHQGLRGVGHNSSRKLTTGHDSSRQLTTAHHGSRQLTTAYETFFQNDEVTTRKRDCTIRTT